MKGQILGILSQIARGAVVARGVGILLSIMFIGILSAAAAFVIAMLAMFSGLGGLFFGEQFYDVTGGQAIVYGMRAVFPFMAVFYLYSLGDGGKDND